MRALVVDDEQDLREMLAENLRRERFAVDTAGDGTEGSYLARTNEYDVIILDNMLPEKSAFPSAQTSVAPAALFLSSCSQSLPTAGARSNS